MGRAALAAGGRRAKNSRAGEVMDERCEQFYEQISALIAAPTRDLAEIERVLTDGYAQALVVEAEKWRLGKRVGEGAPGLPAGGPAREIRARSRLAGTADAQRG